MKEALIEKTEQSSSFQRITSIDALRAFTLLGILLVHATNGFGLSYDGCFSTLDVLLKKGVKLFLVGKCNSIFAILFGVSFYLILRNPNNSSSKFVWRCVLLVFIGLINKVFYSFDALMWYGVWGIVLVAFRKLDKRLLLVFSIAFISLSVFVSRYNIGTAMFGDVETRRYVNEASFFSVVSYPCAVKDYLRIVFNAGVFSTLAKFLFGYWIAMVGFVENIEKRLSIKLVAILWSLFILLFVVRYVFKIKGIPGLKVCINLSASFAYASAFLYLYYHSDVLKRAFSFFEPYGKLGLTNYSMGGIIGVCVMNDFGLGLHNYSRTFVLVFFAAFFLLQALFSWLWLRYFKYGPLEYLWRVGTERKWILNRR